MAWSGVKEKWPGAHKMLKAYRELRSDSSARPADLLLRDLIADLMAHAGWEEFERLAEEAKTMGRERA